MNDVIIKIKKYLWLLLFPVAIVTILSVSSLKEIDVAYARFKFGRDTTLYLRKSTDLLTYLGAAYTTTGDKKFLNQFNEHLKERDKYFKEEVFNTKIIVPEEMQIFKRALEISDDLAKDIENPAFEKMDNKAFFSDKYLDYKKRIIENNQNFRSLINDSSERIIKDQIQLLSIYVYTLCFIILGLVFIIKHNIKPVKKPKRKRKV